MNRTFLKEGAARVVFALAAALSILAVVLICVFLIATGVVLFVFILLISTLFNAMKKRGERS